MSSNASTTRRRGAVLMEVIVAVALFAAAGGVILGSLNGAIRATRRMRIEGQAVDLAVTVLSELRAGLREVTDEGPDAFQDDEGAEDEALADWSWEIVTEQVEQSYDGPAMLRVEVVIRHAPSGYTHRLTHLMPDSDEPDPYAP